MQAKLWPFRLIRIAHTDIELQSPLKDCTNVDNLHACDPTIFCTVYAVRYNIAQEYKGHVTHRCDIRRIASGQYRFAHLNAAVRRFHRSNRRAKNNG